MSVKLVNSQMISSQFLEQVTRLVKFPDEIAYFPTFSLGALPTEKEINQLNKILDQFQQEISLPQSDTQSFYKKLKQLEPSTLNIVSDNGIEWGFKERILQITQYLLQNNMIFKMIENPTQDQIFLQKGQLLVYGLSPYRHTNHFMHEYTYSKGDMEIRFEERKPYFQVEEKGQKQEAENQVKQILKEQKEKEKGFFVKGKEIVNKINHLVTGEKNVKQEKNQIFFLRDKFKDIVKGKDAHILVRDYEVVPKKQLVLYRKDKDQYLQNDEWVKKVEPLNQSLILRTETLVDPKESQSTRQQKSIVLTDVNWLMRGNPWAWIKRFDQD